MHLRLQSKLPLQIWPKTRSQHLTQPVSCNPPCSVHFSVTSGLCRLSQTAAKFSWLALTKQQKSKRHRRALEDEGREVDSPVWGVVSASTVGGTAFLAIVFTVLTQKHVSCLCVQCVCVSCVRLRVCNRSSCCRQRTVQPPQVCVVWSKISFYSGDVFNHNRSEGCELKSAGLRESELEVEVEWGMEELIVVNIVKSI